MGHSVGVDTFSKDKGAFKFKEMWGDCEFESGHSVWTEKTFIFNLNPYKCTAFFIISRCKLLQPIQRWWVRVHA